METLPVRKVLIVDDEIDIRMTIQEICRQLGLEAETAANGKEALELLEHKKFEAVLSDIHMPQMTGIELLEALRASHNNTPFVVLTGFNEKSYAISALRLGATDFVDKPFELKEILQVIVRAVEMGVRNNNLSVHFTSGDLEKASRERKMIDLLKLRNHNVRK